MTDVTVTQADRDAATRFFRDAWHLFWTLFVLLYWPIFAGGCLAVRLFDSRRAKDNPDE